MRTEYSFYQTKPFLPGHLRFSLHVINWSSTSVTDWEPDLQRIKEATRIGKEGQQGMNHEDEQRLGTAVT